jgi:hypothetical protein
LIDVSMKYGVEGGRDGSRGISSSVVVVVVVVSVEVSAAWGSKSDYKNILVH